MPVSAPIRKPSKWTSGRERAPRRSARVAINRRPVYDHLAERRFEFIPFWGFLVFLLYRMRRIHCSRCGVMVEEVPWGGGKHQLTRAYMLFLARWARKLSWKGDR